MSTVCQIQLEIDARCKRLTYIGNEQTKLVRELEDLWEKYAQHTSGVPAASGE